MIPYKQLKQLVELKMAVIKQNILKRGSKVHAWNRMTRCLESIQASLRILLHTLAVS